MNFFLEIMAGLWGSDSAQFLDWGFQEFGYVIFDLLAQPRILESFEQCRILDMGKPAAQRTLHNVVVNHRQPRRLRGVCGKRCRSPSDLRFFITEGAEFWGSDKGRSGK
jgi:hypothetical protein